MSDPSRVGEAAPSSFQALRGRALVLLLVPTIVCALLGLAVAMVSPWQYESEATLIFPRESGIFSPIMSGDPDQAQGATLTALGLPQPRIPTGTYAITIMKSRSALEFLADKFDLQKLWGLSTRESTLRYLGRRLNVNANTKNGGVHLSVYDEDPARARDLLTSCIEFYKNYTSKRSLTTAKRQRIFIEQRLALNRKELEKASKEMMRFERANSSGLVEVEARGKVWEGIKTEGITAEALLRQAEAREQELRSRMLAGVEAQRSNLNFPVAGGDPLLERLQVALVDARLALANLQLSHSSRTVEVSVATKKVKNIEAQVSDRIAALGKAYSAGLSRDLVEAESTLVAAKARSAAYERLKAEQTTTLAHLPAVGMEYADLKRNMKRLETANAMLEMEYQRALVAESRESIDLELLDPPSLPEKPFYPRPRLFTALGACAGLCLGFLVVYLGYRRTKSRPLAVDE